MENKNIICEIKKNIFIENSILETMENLSRSNKTDQKSYDKIINVGEFKNN